MPAELPTCRICKQAIFAEPLRVQALHEDRGSFFDYRHCEHCGCLQIAEIPADLERYYAPPYYAFTRNKSPKGRIRRRLIQLRDRWEFSGQGLLGWALAQWIPELSLRSLKNLALETEARILEVGCGDGELLLKLEQLGFHSLTGVDPYGSESQVLGSAIQLERSLDSVSGPFDLIMMHHSFEHVPDPEPLLRKLQTLLSSQGRLLLRIPLSSSTAFDHYGPHWIQLDAPRHLFLHSEKSLERLLEQEGFSVSEVSYDSTGFQFWGSEQHLRGVPLFHPDSVAVRGHRSPLFSLRELWTFERRAKALNRSGKGDQAIFLARPLSGHSAPEGAAFSNEEGKR